MTSENLTISFEEFVRYLIKKWFLVAGFVLLFAALFVGGAKLLGEEISVPHSEEYLYYEKESEGLEHYLKEAVLMKINPTEIPERTLFLENVTDEVWLKDFVLSTEIWDGYVTGYEKAYLHELLNWQDDEEGDVEDGKAELIVRHVTEEDCLKAAEHLKSRLEDKDAGVLITIGEARITKDEKLQDEQLRWYDRIDYSKSLLLDSQAGYTLKVSLTAAALTGAVAGGMLSVVTVFLMCIFGKKKNKKS